MRLLAVSDLHLGVNRTGGTTQETLATLRAYAHSKHRSLLQLAVTNNCDSVLVNGDLCDSYNVPLSEALEIYAVADCFLSDHPDKSLAWATGNHDLSKDSSRLGTVSFIGAVLGMKYPSRFRLIAKPEVLSTGVYVIPHVANQDLFQLEIDRIPPGVHTVFLHANFDSEFAMQADHSLNLSREQAKKLKAKGIRMIFGHEHQQREALSGSVLVVGNQFSQSVADCLANTSKRALILDGADVSFVQTWTANDADGWYTEVDWKELADVEEEGRGFIRVVGDATVAESSDAIKAIATFRQRSKSFVVTNAVKVESLESLEELAESIEDVRSVNVVELLMELLDPKEREVVQSLFEKDEQ